MSSLTVRLPKSLHEKIKEVAKADGISINQFIATAAAEKVAVILTKEYLEREAVEGRREDFDKVLKSVPDVEPEDYDRL